MDIHRSLQKFEASLSSYTGDDPLDLWERYVGFLEKKLQIEERSSICIVLDRLVQTFLPQKRYSNDIRYINLCIKYASYYNEPIDVYSYIHGEGVGTRTAALYIAWAQCFEKQGLFPQADVVYQRAVENRAEPADDVLQQYQQFQARTHQNQNPVSGTVRNPLQNSQLTNQIEQERETPQSKDPDCQAQFPADATVRIISRSETSVVNRRAQGNAPSLQSVSMYFVNDLVCEGSELCFEELRAQRYFEKCRKQKELRELEEKQRRVQKEKEEVNQLQKQLAELDAQTAAQEPSLQEATALQDRSTDLRSIQQSFRHPQIFNTSAVASAKPELHAMLHGQVKGTTQLEHLPVDALVHGSTQLQPLKTVCVEDGGALPETSVNSENFLQLMENTRRVSQVLPVPPAQSLQASLAAPVLSRTLKIVSPSSEVHTGVPGLQGSAGIPQGQDMSYSMNQPPSTSIQQTIRELEDSRGDVPELGGIQDLSHGATGNQSHTTPNTSLGVVQATPSRVQPSPTVNTREALDVIMNMFQTSNFIHDDPFNVTRQGSAEHDFEATRRNTVINACTSGRQPAVVPFAIFQDEDDKENGGVVTGLRKGQETRVLAEIPVSKAVKQKDSTSCVESMTDDSTVWGPHYNNSLAPCPNTTGDFVLPVHLVSTPFHTNAPHCWDTEQHKENGHHTVFYEFENKPYSRPSKKLSPILEQSPSEEKDPTTVDGICRNQGTIFPEQHTLMSTCLTDQPLVALSFPEQTQGQNGVTISEVPAQGSERDGHIYNSSDLKPEPNWFLSKSLVHSMTSDLVLPRSPEHASVLKRKSLRSQEQAPTLSLMGPKSPQQAPVLDDILPKPDWFVLNNPEHAPLSDLVFSNSLGRATELDIPMSPEHAPMADLVLPNTPKCAPELDIPMSPEHAPMADLVLPNTPRYAPEVDIPMSPEHAPLSDLVLPNTPRRAPKLDIPMSPEQATFPDGDVPMSPAQLAFEATELIADPWDEVLLARLLSTLPTPLGSAHNLRSWNWKVPTITPKTTISLGHECYQIDCIVGQGAFATVYQARDLATSKKLILKVQKPANPWEFYINTQLNSRLPFNMRHLFNNLYSAHLFQNGSVLLGELHNCGTLLNVVNLYKNTNDKVIPQPLAMYFAICILHMVEVLHSIHIIHADIKPDNFMLDDRFLENECFDWDYLDHGLVLIDLGQCIDMKLFPEGTAFTAKCMTSGFQCTEMLSGRPWNYQTDYFGIAGTVYCLIFGTYMKVKHEDGVWKTNAVLKRNTHSELWTEFFHSMLNVPDCKSPPCLRSLRSRLSSELQRSYGNKLRMLKKRLVGLLLESRRTRK